MNLVHFQILIEYLVPRQSLLVELLHEWVWIKLFHIVNTRL